jgi:hypothetical protein
MLSLEPQPQPMDNIRNHKQKITEDQRCTADTSVWKKSFGVESGIARINRKMAKI